MSPISAYNAPGFAIKKSSPAFEATHNQPTTRRLNGWLQAVVRYLSTPASDSAAARLQGKPWSDQTEAELIRATHHRSPL